MATTKVQSELIVDDVALAGNPTTSTQSAGNNTTRIATTAFVTTAVNNLIDSAPGTMDTLNEIAAALGDDPSFTTTVNNAIATKLPLAGGTMTGTIAGFTSTGIDDNADATAITIDSSERVLIGTDSGDAFNADSMLRLQRAGDRVFMQFKTDADQNSGILFGDVDDDVECAIEYEPANKALTFSSGNNVEAFRIDTNSDAIFTGSVTIQDSTTDFTMSGDSSNNTYLVSNGEFRFRPVGTSINKLVIGSNGNITTDGDIFLTDGGTIEAPSSSGSENLLLKAAGGIHLTLDSNGNGGDDQLFKIMKHTGDLVFQVKEDGEVYATNHTGIGTDDPQLRLHVYHPTTNVVARFESGDSQTWIDIHDNDSGNYGCLIGHDSTHDFVVANDAVTKMLMIRRSSRMVEIGNGYGIAVETGRAAAVSINASGYTNVLNFNTIGNGDSRGFYLVSASRNGGSVGTNWIGLVGASSPSASYIYEVLQNSGITAQFSGSWLQMQSSSTHDVHVTAIPIGIHGNDS